MYGQPYNVVDSRTLPGRRTGLAMGPGSRWSGLASGSGVDYARGVRNQLAWLVTLPLAVAGAVFGHAVANALLGVPTDDPATELLAPGRMTVEPVAELVVALLGAVLLAALLARVAGVWRPSQRGVAALPFAAVTPLFFVFQEHLEEFLHSGGVPFDTVLEPTFAPALALQLPFALAAYLIARALLRFADSVRRLLVDRGGAIRHRGFVRMPVRRPWVGRPRARFVAVSHSGRAPPLVSLRLA